MPRNGVQTASSGRVAHLDRVPASETGALQTAARYWKKVTKGEGCWRWTGAVTSAGYGSFGLITTPKPRMVSAHKLSWEWANARAVPDGMVVMHTCDDRLCVRPSHLTLGTVEDNNRDMVAKGRHCKPGQAVCARCGGVGHGRRTCRSGKSTGLSPDDHLRVRRLARALVAGAISQAEAEARAVGR